MMLNKWRLIPDPIAFDSSSELIDGGHSLSSVIEANIPSVFTICSGAPKDAKEAMDQILPRSVLDVVGFQDKKYRMNAKPIHVAVIMTSYSFLGLGALIGLITMVLFLSKTKKNQLSLNGHIKHLTRLNKIVLIVGLYLITIGCFLGAIWANQSWGRYWGWDPKETWCLVTILVYSFVGHMHNMKDFDNDFVFNFGSVIAFSSVLMTYFGVNYFLGGMHSYAAGEASTVPLFVYVVVLAIMILVYVAYFNELRFQPKKSGTK